VECARSVIELIIRYWPYSIDALQPERAIIDGVRPIFFPSQENVRFLSFPVRQGLKVANRPISRSRSLETTGGNPSNSGQTNVRHSVCDISFCTNPFYSGILVRNDAAKDKLQQRLGRSIIMLDLTFLCQLLT